MISTSNEAAIHFDEYEVVALLAGRKTQARVIAKFGQQECPLHVGDRLFVREAFRGAYSPEPPHDLMYEYAATYLGDFFGQDKAYWLPSHVMPREASRILLDVTATRKQRLHDISDEEVIAEGVTAPMTVFIPPGTTMRHFYQSHFESRYGKDLWAANPEMWVIDFVRVMP